MNLGNIIPLKEIDRTNDLDKELNQAKDEWFKARKYFDSVSEPELVDHAIYLLEAAEVKYTYLLKKKKRIKDQEKLHNI